MRKSLHFFALILLYVSLPLAAQTPDWYEAASRKVHYPPEAWYTGFVVGEQQKGEAIEDAYERMKNVARAELVASIRTSVQQDVSMHTQSDQRQTAEGFDEQIQETYVTDTRITSGISDIPGLKIETWSKKDGTIYAFASIRRVSLGNQLIKRLTFSLTKAEDILEQTEQLAEEGKKVEALQMLQKGSQLLHEAEDAQSLLAVVDESADEEMLQHAWLQTLQKRCNVLTAQLKNSVTVYLECNVDLFGEQLSAVEGDIRGELSQLNIAFVTSPEQSDWTIYVTAEAREYNSRQFGTITSYTAYVNATVAVEKTKSAQRIYETHMDAEKGTSTVSYSVAAREAYRQLSPKIAKEIKQQIQ